MKLDYKINVWQVLIIVMLIFLFVYVKFFMPERLNIEITQSPFMSCVSEYNYKVNKICWYNNETHMNYMFIEDDYLYNESII